MTKLSFDIEANNASFISMANEVQSAITELSNTINKQSSNINVAFDQISLDTLEKLQKLMYNLPDSAKGVESIKQQILDLDGYLVEAMGYIIKLQNKTDKSFIIKSNFEENINEISSFDLLVGSINKILDLREQNILLMQQEQNAVYQYKKELKELEEIGNNDIKLSEGQQIKYTQLTSSVMKHVNVISSLQQTLNTEIEAEEIIRESMARMLIIINEMCIAYEQLSDFERSKSFGQELLKNIHELGRNIEQINSLIDSNRQCVNDYCDFINQLDFGSQQVARETPLLAENIKMFLNVIGSNIPFLSKMLGEAKQKNEELKISGKQIVPIWKQMISSLFSWHTTLNVGVTLLTLYGDKIANWMARLIKSSDIIGANKTAQDALNQASLKGMKGVQEEITNLEVLYKASQNETYSKEERLRIIHKLQQEYPNYFGNLSAEEIMVGKAENAYLKLSESIIKAANAKAYADSITENKKEILDLENELEKLFKERSRLEKIESKNVSKLSKGPAQATVASRKIYDNSKNTSEVDSKISELQSLLREKEVKGIVLKGKLNVSNLIWEIDDTTNEYAKSFWREQLNVANSTIDKIKPKDLTVLKSGDKDNIAKLPKNIVKQYEDATILRARAMKALSVYDDNISNDNQAEKIRNQQKQLNDLLESQSRERQRLEQDLGNQNRQAEIDAMEEGADKTLAQMIFTHEREMQELDREKEEFLQKKRKDAEDKFNANEELEQAKTPSRAKQTFDSTKIQLSENETQVFNDRESNIGKKQDNELKAYAKSQRQAMNESLKEYGTYEEKRKAITEIYNEKIAKGKTESEKLALGQSLTKELSDLDIEANKATATFSKLFSDMSKSSVKDMRAISKEAKSALEYVKGGKFETGSDGKGKYGISADTFKHLQESPEEVAKMEKGIEGLDAEADKCDTAFNKIAIGFKKAFDAGSDPKKVREALAEIEAGMNEVMQAGQFLSNSFSSLGDALGSETMGKVAEGMNVAMDAAGAAMSGAQAGAMFGPWGAAAGAAIGLVSSLGSSLARLGDAKHEKNIQQIQDKIEVLEKSYNKLGDSIEKSYSSDASKLIEQQNTLLEQQKVLIKNQIAEEQSKKKSDSGRIKDWENQIEEIDKAIAEGKEKAIDVLLGEDVKAAIDNFAQAYADAWSAGDDRAKSSKDLVKQMIKQMIVEAIKATTSAPMEKLRQKLAGYFSDGIISAWEREQIEKDAEAIANELDSKYAWADEYMKGEGDSSSQESTKGGFETMSQETGSELNGRFSAMQVANEEMRISMQSMVINLASLNSSVTDGNLTLTEMRNVAIMSNSYLQDIAGYTKRILVDFGVKLDSIITNTKGL